jgi:hypothetical protein
MKPTAGERSNIESFACRGAESEGNDDNRSWRYEAHYAGRRAYWYGPHSHRPRVGNLPPRTARSVTGNPTAVAVKRCQSELRWLVSLLTPGSDPSSPPR